MIIEDRLREGSGMIPDATVPSDCPRRQGSNNNGGAGREAPRDEDEAERDLAALVVALSNESGNEPDDRGSAERESEPADPSALRLIPRHLVSGPSECKERDGAEDE